MSSASVSAYLGFDVGTSSSKAVLVDRGGQVLRTVQSHHNPTQPTPRRFEMDMATWWDEFVHLTRELLDPTIDVLAVGISGMGPCLGLTDGERPTRSAILYGIDTRATEQIVELTERLGAHDIVARCGSPLTTQSVGPKLAWVRQHQPEVYRRSRQFYMPSSWLVRQLTNEYVLDHHSASQCAPLYDLSRLNWYQSWVDHICPHLEMPRLLWPCEVAGAVTAQAAAQTGLRQGTPVITGTIDAWAEAVSVGADQVGDLMVMYGTTMFLIHTTDHPLRRPPLWGTVGAEPGTFSLAAGLATAGSITSWLRDLAASPGYGPLVDEAEQSPPGSRGLLLLPYFAGERTPIMDPDARGLIAGLTLSHRRGDVYRAALEGTAMAVRHNIEAMHDCGAQIERVIAVGGGVRRRLWPQIVSDVTGLEQQLPTTTIGASYGSAVLAARSGATVQIEDWNPLVDRVQPRADVAALYGEHYHHFRHLYEVTRRTSTYLARSQERGPT